jgi:hypothetical protein
MSNLKSERHHWWPECVSSHWAAKDGTTGWIKPDGTSIRVPPKNLGLIGNGHHIKLSRHPGDSTHWDTSFEREFDAADSNFPKIISWLSSLNCDYKPSQKLRDRFLEQLPDDDVLRKLTECVVSLAVRGPMTRKASVSLADRLRGSIPKKEREALIGLNMRNSQRTISDSIGSNAKFAVLFSQGKEFIFGDGFFHNLTAVTPMVPKILAPITPNLSVIVTRPASFTVLPRLSTIVLTEDEVNQCNHAVQVYSCQAIYFRNHQPDVVEAFTCNEHRKYTDPDNPIDNLLCSIPGIPPRDRSLDFLIRNL